MIRSVDTRRQSRPKRPPSTPLPPWKVLLHNDDVNVTDYVVETIVEIARLTKQVATVKMLEAHNKGKSLLLTTHRERAEFLCVQFKTKNLTVTIEAA